MKQQVGPLSLVALIITTAAPAQRSVHTDDELGVKLTAPPRWAYLGAAGDLGSLRALFAAPRVLAAKVAQVQPHTPVLRVLWFPKRPPPAEKQPAPKWPLRSPYLDYKDYLGRVYGPLTKVLTTEAGTVGALNGRRIHAQALRGGGIIELHAAVVPREGGELALEFEVLPDHSPKLKGQFDKCFDSLAATPVVKPTAGAAQPTWQSDPAAWRKLPTAERATQRKAFGTRFLAERGKHREPGWRTQVTRHFVVLTRADSRSTTRIVQAAEVVRAWAESRLDKVSDDVVMPAVLRIFADRRELTAFSERDSGVREYRPELREIHYFRDPTLGNAGTGFGPLVRGVFWQCLHDKHSDVLDNMPRWLDQGLWSYLESSRLKGKKLELFPGEVELGRYRNHARNKTPGPALWDLIQERAQPLPKDGSVEKPWGYIPESARLLRWLDAGGSTFFKQQDLLAGYLGQIGKTAVELGPSPDLGVDWLRLDEAKSTELRKLVQARKVKFLEKVNFTLIPISDAEWRAADAAFIEYNAKLKR